MHPCDRYLNPIHELVDGTLGPIRRAELEQHLDVCDTCRALAEDLQAIARTSRSLDPLAPPDRVWRQVADRLRAEGRVAAASPRYGGRNLAMLALAATLLLAVGASLFMLRRTGGSQGATAAPPAPGAQAGPVSNAPASDPVQDVATELALAERHFQNAIERATEAGDGVNPATAAVLQKTLLTVNDAIAETHKAMETDPSAQQGLYDMLKKKIQFLQDTIALMNEMRQGDAAGVAQIVEGGKS